MAWNYVVTTSYGALTQAQREENATEFYNYFITRMTIEALCGIIGNVDIESQLNPGQQEGGYGGSPDRGYGLIQWTPQSGYPNPLLQWASYYGYNWYDGAAQCKYIYDEGSFTNTTPGAVDERVWWNSPSHGYYYTWEQFKALTNVEEATKAYCYQRERASVAAEQLRINAANYWYEYFSGQPPTPPTPPTPVIPTSKMPLWFYLKKLF